MVVAVDMLSPPTFPKFPLAVYIESDHHLDGDGEDNCPFKVSILPNLRRQGWGRGQEDKAIFARRSKVKGEKQVKVFMCVCVIDGYMRLHK